MPLEIACPYPLSPAQQGILFHALHSEGGLYKQQYCYRLRGQLHETSFRLAWDRTIARHDILRTAFVWEHAGEPVQIVNEHASLPLAFLDWSDLTSAEQERQLETFLAEDRAESFDLSSAPLARGAAIRLSGGRFCFVWTHHHLILDGWSNMILLQEVMAQYAAISTGTELDLPQPKPYSSYIAWLDRQPWAEAESYWHERLDGIYAPTPLTLEAPELPGVPALRAKQGLRLAAPVWTRLKELAREHHVTPGTIVQGCWALLLSSYAAQRRVLFGVTSSGRPAGLEGSDSMVGLFINVVPALIELDPASRIFPWLRTIQREQAIAREFQHTPLVEVQAWSRIPRGTPLFESLVSFENYPLDVFERSYRGKQQGPEPPFQIEDLQLAEHSNFPLTLIAAPGDTLLLTLSFDSGRFAEGAIERLLTQLRGALENIASHPQQLCSEVLPRPVESRRRPLERCEDAPAACKFVHQEFARCAAKTPDAVVLAYHDEQITYCCLEERANRLAAFLSNTGVGPETRVAVLMKRTPNWVLGMLGVLKSGGVYIPVDPGLPTARLATLFDDAQPAIVLTERGTHARMPATWAQIIDLDANWSEIAAAPAAAPETGLSARNLAYIIYTSGSTGRPKGVGVDHGNIGHYVQAVSERIAFPTACRFALLSTAAADLGHTALFPALLGSTLHLVDEDTATSAAELAAYAARHSIDCIKITPSHLRALLSGSRPAQVLPERRLILGGESSNCEWVSELAHTKPACEIWNHYGPTECTVGALARRVTPDLLTGNLRNLPLGEPFDGVETYIVDAEGNLAPEGAPGELWIGGATVARGYLDQPAITAERFVPDAFGAPGGRLYRTGDRVRRRSNGELEFLGRADDQIKLRGYRVELGEIEATLSAHSGVRQCAVVLREGPDRDPRLVAYVLPHGNSGIEGYRQYLQEHLPVYMVPSVFVELDRWPLLPNGKLDRSALPEPEAPPSAPISTRPWTPVEEIVAGIWREVLHLEQVGLDDDFFGLGGHSLLATQVVARVRTVLQVELPVRTLFERPTIAGVAAEVAAMRHGMLRSPAPPLTPMGLGNEAPLSFAQQRLWFIEQLQPGQATYNVPKAVRLNGPLNVAALRRSLTAIVQRHEVLRTCFHDRSGQPVQVVMPPIDVPLPVVDLSGCPEQAREALAQNAARAEALTPFSLAQAPLMRARLLRMGRYEHIALITLHHIASDGWSIGILNRELSALYNAACNGAPALLPELPIQYRDFSDWQRAWLNADVLEEQIRYWRTQLDGVAALDLPSSRSRGPALDDRGARLHWTVPSHLVAQVRAFSQRESVSSFMTLLAAFQLLLGRLAGQTDVAVGTDVANRTHVQTEGLIGFFVNQIVLRTDLRGDPTFAELLAHVRETTLEAYAHQDLPFEKLVEELAPARSLNRAPFFQVKLVLQNVPRAEAALDGISIEGFGKGTEVAKIDLTLSIEEDAGGMRGTLEYAAALYDRAAAQRLLDCYERLLDHAVQEPACRISALRLLSEQEQHQLLYDWNATGRMWSLPATVDEAVAARAQTCGDAVAVVFEDQHLSYRALNERANQLAHYLEATGVGSETIVALCLDRGIDLMIGLLGILKSGGAYLPVDPTYPPARIATMLEAAQVPVLVTDESLAATLPSSWVLPVYLDRDAAEIAACPSNDPQPGRTSDALAYVMFTSGSTGKPKGVMVTHGGVLNLAASQIEAFGITAGSSVLQFASFSFDAATSEWSTAWLAGAQLVLARVGDLLPGPALGRVMEQHGVNVVTWPPSFAAALLDPVPPPDTLVLAGEPSSAELVARWTGAGCRVLNAYGPTEATVCATISGPASGDVAPPIGWPLSNACVYVLDRDHQLAPVMTPGEIYVGGAGVARGYLNQPTLTASSFIPDPFGLNPGARLYRTGDRARWLPDGQLEFLGRRDHQIKLRGHRIELGEIEAALESHPGVRQSAAALVNQSDGDPRLVAYVVPAGPAPSWDALRRHLRERLPDYMVPQTAIVIDRLPVTPSGKLDRAALQAYHSTVSVPTCAPRPLTPIEDIIAGIWSEVLHREPVSSEDDFFMLGGHSLLATQVIARLREAFGLELPLRVLFESPTVRALAQRVAQARDSRTGAQLPPIAAAFRPDNIPLSHAQQRLWFIDRLTPARATYNLPYAVRLRGPLNIRAVTHALTAIVERHEILRTTFALSPDDPAQRIMPAVPVPVPLINVPSETLARRIAAEEARRPFDLGNGPLLRASVLRLGDRDHVLLVTTHHIVSDGWSIGILMREFQALYMGGSLAPLPIQYADVALWQQRWLTGPVLDQQLAYWRNQLDDLPVLELPTDRRRPIQPSHRGSVQNFFLPPELCARIRSLSRLCGATTFMTLLAAFKLLMSRYSGQTDIVVGTSTANRTHVELEGLIGFFVNQLVFRTRLKPGMRVLNLLDEVRNVTLDAYSNQDVEFGWLVEQLHPARDLSRSPMYQVAFELQSFADQDSVSIPFLSSADFSTAHTVAKQDLAVVLREQREGGIAGSIEFSTDLFESRSIASMTDRFVRVVEEFLEDPERPVDGIALLAPEEALHLAAWNRTGIERPGPFLACELVAARAAESPDRIAVACEQSYLSYGALAARARRLAGYLRAMGAGPDVCVALFCERGLDLLTGVLGILEAGAAYLPLDPRASMERIAWQLDDTHAPIILTQQALRPALPASWAHVICLDSEWETVEAEEPVAPGAVDPDHLAYVTYTSGSTGRPKGCAVTHRSLCNLAHAQIKGFGISEDTRVLQFASFTFDAAASEWSTTLIAGGTLVIPTGDQTMPDALPRLLVDQKIGVVTLPPSMAALLPVVTSLETLVLAGEAAPPAVITRWASSCRVINAYGPTETTVCATMSLPLAQGDVPVIGYPIDNVQVYVVDPAGQLAPVNVAGELLIGGAGVARGYFERPALSAERFVPDPFGSQPGGRLYRSGDRVRRLASGAIEFLGRKDQQVKLRGYRIEPGEIEAVLEELDGVAQAAVVMEEDTSGDQQLVAYVSPTARNIRVEELRQYLQRRLPAYMIPGAFILLPSLPRTTNGKLDRRALKRTGESGVDSRSLSDPRDTTEAHVRQIWEELLDRRGIGLREDFFQIGGHSLKAVALAARLSRAYGKDLPVRLIFDHGTIEAQADYLRREVAVTPPNAVVPLRTAPSGEALFCIPPAGGLVHPFVSLARYFDGSRLYALQAAGFEEGVEPVRDVRDMATRYIEEIRSVQTHGPYFLAGLSMGGAVAFEMACQLHAEGHAVGLVALLDPTPLRLSAAAPDLDWEQEFTDWERQHLKEAAFEDLGLQLDTSAALDQIREQYLEEALRLGKIPPGVTSAQFRRFLRVFGANTLAVNRYRPAPYLGKNLVLFRTDPIPGFDDTYGWGQVASSGIELHVFPGRHGALIAEPLVLDLVRNLQMHLEAQPMKSRSHSI